MTDTTLSLARRGDEDAFRALTDPYRRVRHLHRYRILASAQDAEDVLTSGGHACGPRVVFAAQPASQYSFLITK